MVWDIQSDLHRGSCHVSIFSASLHLFMWRARQVMEKVIKRFGLKNVLILVYILLIKNYLSSPRSWMKNGEKIFHLLKIQREIHCINLLKENSLPALAGWINYMKYWRKQWERRQSCLATCSQKMTKPLLESQVLSWRMMSGWGPGEPGRYSWDKRQGEAGVRFPWWQQWFTCRHWGQPEAPTLLVQASAGRSGCGLFAFLSGNFSRGTNRLGILHERINSRKLTLLVVIYYLFISR